jgi:hypothetical protein
MLGYSIIILGQAPKIKLMPLDKNQRLQITLLENEIVATDRGFNLKLLLSNKTDTSFILYSFKIMRNGGPDQEYFKQGMGTNLFPSDQLNRYIKFEMDSKLDRTLKYGLSMNYNRDTIDNVFTKSLVVIKARSTQEINIPVKLRGGFLKKGIYSLFMIYSCGVNILPYGVKENIMRKDKQKHKALVYQGYVKSNSVKLKVVKTHPVERLEDLLKHD